MSPTSIGKKRVSFQRRKAAVPAATAPVPAPAPPSVTITKTRAMGPSTSLAKDVQETQSTAPYGDATADAMGAIPVQSFQDVWRKYPGAWFESWGVIWDKEGNITGYAKDAALQMNQMQEELDEILAWCNANNKPCRIVTLKGRQQGSSTWSVAALYHFARRFGRSKVCIIGDTYERSVKNLEAMFNRYAAADEFAWGSTYDKPSRKFSNGSELTTESANSNRAGASGTLRAVLATETAHWLETPGVSAKAVFSALLTCVPKGKNSMIIVESTPNGVGGIYYDTYQKAVSFEDMKAGRVPSDWNGFVRVFYAWHEHPEYHIEQVWERQMTESEIEDVESSLTERELELRAQFPHITTGQLRWRRMVIASPDFNGDEEKFEQEFASDPERCFLLSGRRCFPLVQLNEKIKRAEAEGQMGLHPKVLKWADPHQRIASMQPASDDDAWIKIWEEPKPGLRYSLSVDPASGQAEGGDPDNHSIGVWREGYFDNWGKWWAPKMVARVTDFLAEKRLNHEKAACKWSVALAEDRVAMAAAYYGWCQIVVEENKDPGFIELLKLRPRANLYIREQFNRTVETTTKIYGWLTTEKTRKPIIENVKRAVLTWKNEGGGIDILDVPTLKEMMTMIVDKKGKEVAMRGHHDDQVLQTAIGIQTLSGGTIMPNPGVNRMARQQPTDSTYRA